MSRVFHAEKDNVFVSRHQIEQHLLAKIEKNTAGKIGTELELFVTSPEGLPITFDQVEMLLEYMAEQLPGTERRLENGRIVGLHIPALGDVCLEPGGQVELSTKPCADIDELQKVHQALYAVLGQAAAFFDLRVKGQGHMPAFTAAEDMPRSRFAAYYRYCHHEIGDKADDLIKTMKSVCGLQINVDPMGNDFHEVYRALLLLDVSMTLGQQSERQSRLDRTYARFFPEQLTPVFQALDVSSNQEVVALMVDRLLTLKVPFLPDQSPEGFKSSLDVFGQAPTVGALLAKGLLTEEILDNALSLQLTMPNLRRHGVLETRAPDSVNTTEELLRAARLYHDVAYHAETRRALLNRFKDVDIARLQHTFVHRSQYGQDALQDLPIGGGLTVRDLAEVTSVLAKPSVLGQKQRSPSPSPVSGLGYT